MWSCWYALGRESATTNQTFGSMPAAKRCSPNFTTSPASRVTTKVARTASPQAWRPSPNPRAVSSAPITANTAMRGTRYAYAPPGSPSTTSRAPNDTLIQYLSRPTEASRTYGTIGTAKTLTPPRRLNPCRFTSNNFASWVIASPPYPGRRGPFGETAEALAGRSRRSETTVGAPQASDSDAVPTPRRRRGVAAPRPEAGGRRGAARHRPGVPDGRRGAAERAGVAPRDARAPGSRAAGPPRAG